jgi:AcrR family transcriptional regulator
MNVDVFNIRADVKVVNMSPQPARPARKRSTYHHGDLKRALVDAALVLVAEKGPKGFTLTEAARRAGVSLAAPYRHFADKAHLLAAVAEQGFLALGDALTDGLAAHPDPAEQVVECSRRYVAWAVAHPDHYRVMFGGDTDKQQHPGLLAAGERTFGVLLDVITRCQAAGLITEPDPRRVAGTVWSSVHGVASLAIGGDLEHVGIEEAPTDLAARSAADVLKGLGR